MLKSLTYCQICNNELINLRLCECTISQEMTKIPIVSSKTDQFRQINKLLVARTNILTCPITMLEHYMCRTSVTCDDECFIICLQLTNAKMKVGG